MKTLKKTALSAMTIALYFALMYLTQSFAFYGVQIRVATALYALAFVFPFLTPSLALANALSNLLGGLGAADVFGGLFAGLFTSIACAYAGKKKKAWGVIPAIALIPSLLVPIWLSYLLSVPYHIMLISVLLGQIAPAILGYILVKALKGRKAEKWKA